MAGPEKPRVNGSRHIITLYAGLIAIAVALVGGGVWAGTLAQKAQQNKEQGDRRDTQFGQMDMRQRTLENNSATIRQQLKTMEENQKRILEALRQR